jgi:hypothetical protein
MDAIYRVDGNRVVTSPNAAGPWDAGMQLSFSNPSRRARRKSIVPASFRTTSNLASPTR